MQVTPSASQADAGDGYEWLSSFPQQPLTKPQEKADGTAAACEQEAMHSTDTSAHLVIVIGHLDCSLSM